MKLLVAILLLSLVAAQDSGDGQEEDDLRELLKEHEKKQEELQQELQRELEQQQRQELNRTIPGPPPSTTPDESPLTSTSPRMAPGLIRVVRLAGLFDLGGEREGGGGGCTQLEMGNSMPPTPSISFGRGDRQLLSAVRWAAEKLEAVAKDVRIGKHN